jgi:hypothetical protein
LQNIKLKIVYIYAVLVDIYGPIRASQADVYTAPKKCKMPLAGAAGL